MYSGSGHTAGVVQGLVSCCAAAGRAGVDPTTPTPAESVEFTAASVGVALVATCLAALPLGVSVWALLDAARRPRWAWALADRRQVVWIALVLFGMLSIVGGLPISAYYLMRVRSAVAAAEAGDF